MVGKLLLFCAIFYVALAGTAEGPLQPKPEKFKDVEGCYIKDLDAVIPYGQKAPSKTSCVEYTCNQDSVIYALCGFVDAGPGTKKVQDKSKPYPGCCPRLVPA